MRKIKGFRGGVRTMIHLNAPMTKPHKRIAKRPRGNGKTASARTQNVAIMHVGMIGPKPAKNTRTAKNHQHSANKKPHAKYLAHGPEQHACVIIWANGMHLKKCVNATPQPRNTRTASVSLSPRPHQGWGPARVAHNSTWAHAHWEHDK